MGVLGTLIAATGLFVAAWFINNGGGINGYKTN